VGEDEHVALSEIVFFYRRSCRKKEIQSYAPSEEKVLGWRMNLTVPPIKHLSCQTRFPLIERSHHVCLNAFREEVELCLHSK